MEAEQLSLLGKSYFENKDVDKALGYYIASYEMANSIGSLIEQRNSVEGMYQVYKSKNDVSKALFYHERLTRLNDSIFNSTKSTAFNNLKTQFALDRQEHELKVKSDEELKKKEVERKQQRLINYVVIAILLLVLVFSYFLYQRFKITNSQKKIIEHQKHIVEKKNQEVTDSIHFAQRIQKEHLPSDKYISKKMNELKNKLNT
ncbi:MAG: hypothetical protein IPJ32_21280 [Sphingobacteriaceae bacterium]|nr:hypothetical protein [Sphingobacteriaceae bacterium]